MSEKQIRVFSSKQNRKQWWFEGSLIDKAYFPKSSCISNDSVIIP